MMLRRRIGSIVCWSMVVLFVFSSSCGSWIVAAEGSGEPILALTLDGKPAYPTPYMIPSANSSTMNQSPNPSAPSPSAAAPTYWWNQYQDNWYHDGWASADPTYTPTSGLIMHTYQVVNIYKLRQLLPLVVVNTFMD